jgi:hypothetical protein
MSKAAPTDRQLAILQGLAQGEPLAEIAQKNGISVSGVKRTRIKFAALLSERDDEVLSKLTEARSLSAQLVIDALDHLGAMMISAEEIGDKLAVISQVLRAYALLNPPVAPPPSAPSVEDRSSQVVVYLPSNNRGDVN